MGEHFALHTLVEHMNIRKLKQTSHKIQQNIDNKQDEISELKTDSDDRLNITFIGNCQLVSLCFYFQQLLSKNNNIRYVTYGEEFKPQVGSWSGKCKNKIVDYDISIQTIKDSDIIIYQNIDVNKSLFSNTNTLSKLTNNSCKLIKIPSIYLLYNDFDNSIKELINRENENNVDIKVSDIFYKFRNYNLMLTLNHPKTLLFMEIIQSLCNLLNFNFFTKEQYNNYLKNENYMGLPC